MRHSACTCIYIEEEHFTAFDSIFSVQLNYWSSQTNTHWILTDKMFCIFCRVLSVVWARRWGKQRTAVGAAEFCSAEEQMGETRQGRMNSGQKEGDSRAWPPTCPPHSSPSVSVSSSLPHFSHCCLFFPNLPLRLSFCFKISFLYLVLSVITSTSGCWEPLHSIICDGSGLGGNPSTLPATPPRSPLRSW